MDSEFQRSFSSRVNRRGERNVQNQHAKDVEGGFISPGKLPSDYPMKIVWKKGFIRLFLVGGILWMLLILTASLFHVWSCHSSISFFSAMCNKESKVFTILDSMGFMAKAQHRCSIPLADEADRVVIPKGRTPDEIVKKLVYITEDEHSLNGSQTSPLFGGHQNWTQREESFKLKPTMKVHCGFMRSGGAVMVPADIKYVEKCRFVVASGIFDGYDVPRQPSNISVRSKDLFCFLMVVDEISMQFIKENVTIEEDNDGGKWVGIWRLVLLKYPPYDEPRRNGKVPKILTHRLFPQAQYSIWIDGKMELIVDPLLILERYLWRGKHTFAIAQHKHHRSVYEEADSNKRRKRYARPLIDLHMKIYRYEGMEPWSPEKKTVSDVPEGAIIIREHTTMSDLFSCLWFNEVHMFTPRDQLSFATSYTEWVKDWDQLKGNMSSMKEYKQWKHRNASTSLIETRGGLGLWTPYPGNLDSVVLPTVVRSSKAG